MAQAGRISKKKKKKSGDAQGSRPYPIRVDKFLELKLVKSY